MFCRLPPVEYGDRTSRRRLCVCQLKPPREKQDDDDNQDDAEDADAAMTIAIAVAAEAATEPTEQRDDQDNDEDESKRRHGAVLPFPRCGEARLSIYHLTRLASGSAESLAARESGFGR